MAANIRTAHKSLLTGIFVFLSVFIFVKGSPAKIPEPGNIIYGVAGNDIDTVLLKRDETVVASYTTSSNKETENYYILRVSLDSIGPREPWDLRAGDEVAIYVNGESEPVVPSVIIGERGTLQEINLLRGDGDADGLPDDWENQYGLSSSDGSGVNGKDGDPDNDTWTNFQEYVCGTDPRNSQSAPSNNAPSAPALNYPGVDLETGLLQPVLSVNNSTDSDGHTLTYSFELYSDEALTSLVASAMDEQEDLNATVWKTDIQLNDNSLYYWRARSFDGFDHSEWMAAACFFVNTGNDLPLVPQASLPFDGAGVPEPTELVVVNSTDVDRDPLVYDFRVYADEQLTDLVVSSESVVENSSGQTLWTVWAGLYEETDYWWTARAVDDEGGASDWSVPASFFMTASNGAPSDPVIVYPALGEEIETIEPVLQVVNATDPDDDALSYLFQIDKVNAFNSPIVQKDVHVAEGEEGQTSWAPSPLSDNTTWYWRVAAYDGISYSNWSEGVFLTNLENAPPSVPVLNSPGDGGRVESLTPVLRINAASDVDNDMISYTYEVYADNELNSLVCSVELGETSWQVDTALEENGRCFWRVRAVDGHGAAGGWSPVASFFVNTINEMPSPPVLNNPVSGGTVTVLAPEISIVNSTDPDVDSLSYEFELYSDKDLTKQVGSSVVPTGEMITSWIVSEELTDNTVYYWRARALDGSLAGGWMPTAVFVVNSSGSKTVVTIRASVEVPALAADSQIIEITEEGNPLAGLVVEIPAGALDERCTIMIADVSNPPSLPANTLSIGRAVEFMPSGIHFNTPVTISFPYTQAELDKAGIDDPSKLEVMVYDITTLSWQKIPVESVDEANRRILCKTDHFSMYATCAPAGTGTQSAADEGGGNSSCFIRSAGTIW